MTTHQVITGDCRVALANLEAGTVQTIVTSPPYFGLRDYKVAGQIGLEERLEDYITNLVHVFAECRRVLRDDGTLWVNLGDGYAGGGGFAPDAPCNQGRDFSTGPMNAYTPAAGSAREKPRPGHVPEGLKPKDLIGAPWRLAFALQSDGWYLRQDIVWNKPSVMPESCKDRCTRAHEYLFLLAKSRQYFFDHEAMREPGVYPAGTRAAKGSKLRKAQDGVNARPPEYAIYDGMRNRRSVWSINPARGTGVHFATFPEALVRPCILAGSRPGDIVLDPFGGAGTVGAVACEVGRNSISIELNPEYADFARGRINQRAQEMEFMR